MNKKTGSLRIDYDVETPMRDGTILRSNLFRPDDDKRYPAILLRFPYEKDGFARRCGPLSAVEIAHAGYNVLWQDVRGTGKSEGVFDLMTCEGPDGYDTVEWIANQSWCDGSVGMYGLSYYGFTQLTAAEQQPPHLKAICPFQQASTIKYSGGFLPNALHLDWVLQQAKNFLRRDDLKPPVLEEVKKHLDEYMKDLRFIQMYVPEREVPVLKMKEIPCFQDYLNRIDNFDNPEYSRRTEGRPVDLKKIEVPSLIYAGWYDGSSKNGPIENYVKFVTEGANENVRAGSRLVIGPWPHGTTFSTQHGERSFPGADGESVDVQGHLIRWFDYWLKGKDTGVRHDPPVRIYVMGDNVWRNESEWPLARTVYTSYFLTSGGEAEKSLDDGRLETKAVSNSSYDEFTYDPHRPVPSRVPGGCAGAVQDQRPIEEREDVLVYSTAVLEREVEVTGSVKAELYISTSAKDTDFMCKLVDVEPGGKALNITDGAVRASYNNTYIPHEIAAGEICQLTVDLGNTSIVFKKGHQIRLEVTSSNFPVFDRNHNTGKRPGTDPELLTAINRVYHDELHASRLILPVIPR